MTETTLIFDGLDEGIKIVVEPLINVKENMPVGILVRKRLKADKPQEKSPGNHKQNKEYI